MRLLVKSLGLTRPPYEKGEDAVTKTTSLPRIALTMVVAVAVATLVALVWFTLSADAASPKATTKTFTNGNQIRIPADRISGGTEGKADPYPSTIKVSGFKSVTDVNVTIRSATHTNPDDLDVLLAGPTGATAILWSDAGGTNSLFPPPDTGAPGAGAPGATTATGPTTLTLDDEAQVFLPDSGQIGTQTNPSGRYKPSNYEVGVDDWPGLTQGSDNNKLSTFDGTNPTGEWKLYVFDDTNNLTRATGTAQAPLIAVGHLGSRAQVNGS
jgi:subtilisin-like proprotein convertase family protein